jgi:chromosome segregation ATPase
MSETVISNIITAIIAFVGGGGGVFILNFLRQQRDESRKDNQQVSELKLSETEKAFGIYKEIVTSLKHDIEQISTSSHELEKLYGETREQKALLQGKYDLALSKIETLETQINLLKEKENAVKHTS